MPHEFSGFAGEPARSGSPGMAAATSNRFRRYAARPGFPHATDTDRVVESFLGEVGHVVRELDVERDSGY